MIVDYESFIKELKEFFLSTPQTTWGKHQIVDKIQDLEISFLQRYISELKKGG
jgi:hypothetical protein